MQIISPSQVAPVDLIWQPVWVRVVHVPGEDVADVVPVEGVGGPGGEQREADEPEDDAEDVEGKDGPAVVESNKAGGGEVVVGGNYKGCDALGDGKPRMEWVDGVKLTVNRPRPKAAKPPQIEVGTAMKMRRMKARTTWAMRTGKVQVGRGTMWVLSSTVILSSSAMEIGSLESGTGTGQRRREAGYYGDWQREGQRNGKIRADEGAHLKCPLCETTFLNTQCQMGKDIQLAVRVLRTQTGRTAGFGPG